MDNETQNTDQSVDQEIARAEAALAAALRKRSEALEQERLSKEAALALRRAQEELRLAEQRRLIEEATARAEKRKHDEGERIAAIERDRRTEDARLAAELSRIEETQRLERKKQKKLQDLDTARYEAEREADRISAELARLSQEDQQPPSSADETMDDAALTGQSGVAGLLKRAGVNLQFPQERYQHVAREEILPAAVNPDKNLHVEAPEPLTLPARGKLEQIAPVIHAAPVEDAPTAAYEDPEITE